MQDYSGVDLVHIYRFLDQPEDFTCIGLIEVLKRTLPQESQAKGIEQFIWLTLFDALIGNDDRHGRNIGLIHTPDGYTLAPFFDNPSYIGTESPLFLGFELNPTGAIATNTTQEPTMRDYALQFTELGYAYHVASFKKRAHNPEIQYLIKRSLLSDQRQNAFLTLLERRREELNG